MSKKDPKIVVIGGGTGSFTLLSKLKNYTNNITAIVNMADDGGSTGILRDELGVLPPGDVRQCLVALSEDQGDLRDLFNYRFGEGSLSGHSFGNLFLSALEKTSDDFEQAVQKAGKILKITGSVHPVTLVDSRLVKTNVDKSETVGQVNIEFSQWESKMRPNLSLQPKARLNPKARQAIVDAELVVVAPGNLYSSLAPALLVDGMDKALRESRAKKVYVCNLVTKPGQTDDFSVANYADEIERFVGEEFLDFVIYNTHTPSKELLEKYAKENEYGVEVDQQLLNKAKYKTVGVDLVAEEIYKPDPNDTLLPRTLIRHDADKVAKQLLKLL